MKQNRKILTGLYNNGIRLIARADLECFGFSFKGITGLEMVDKGGFHVHCFEYDLVKHGNRFQIEKQQL